MAHRANGHAVYIVDMDGTLYFKRSMQLGMALRLMLHYLLRFYRLRELLILSAYRKLRDKDELSEDPDFEQVILEQLSRKYRRPREEIRRIVDTWILTRPLKLLPSAADRRLLAFLKQQQLGGKRVYVYSDYPADKKCAALGLQPSGIYWPDGVRITTLKPAPQGLEHIIESNRLERTQILFIGDRLEKDGVCARSAGVDHLILKKGRLSRHFQYQHLARSEASLHDEAAVP